MNILYTTYIASLDTDLQGNNPGKGTRYVFYHVGIFNADENTTDEPFPCPLPDLQEQ